MRLNKPFAFVVILLMISCQSPPADIEFGFYERPELTSNEQIQVPFGWKTKTFSASNNALLELIEDDQRVFLLSTKYVIVIAGQNGSDNLLWSGRRDAFNGANARTLPVQVANPYRVVKLKVSIQKPNSELYLDYTSDFRMIPNLYDSDSDDISDLVEIKNNGNSPQNRTPIVDPNGGQHFDWFSSGNVNLPPIISTTLSQISPFYQNRGTHDYSLARGIPTNGTLLNGLRIADASTGYLQDPGFYEPRDYDNWGILALINLVEKVGREWQRLYPNYPLIAILDISRWQGGLWDDGVTRHAAHQNGLDMDIRYVRSDNSSEPVKTTDGVYSRFRTQQLLNLLFLYGNITRIYSADQLLNGITPDADHYDHFHVRIADPDGTN